MIKAVMLDVDDTLLDFDANAKYSIDCAAKEYGLTVPENIMEVFGKVNVELWQQIETGELDRDGLLHKRFNLIFEQFGMNVDGYKFDLLFCHYLKQAIIEMPYARELLEYLKDKYVLAVASNATYSQQLNRLKLADFDKYFAHIFVSEKVGYSKPAKEFYDYCISELGLRANQILMIGDSLTSDIKGGHKAGMQTIWYDFRKTGKQNYATYTVTDLREIKEIL